MPLIAPGSLVAVSGATGNQGNSVVRALSDAGYRVRALTRSPNSPASVKAFDGLKDVEIVPFDFADRSSVERAFVGAAAVFGVTVPDFSVIMGGPPSGPSELDQGKVMADVAKEQGVELFIWSSVTKDGMYVPKYRKLSTVFDKQAVEDHARSIGLRTLPVYVGSFFENFVRYGGMALKDDGSLVVHRSHANMTEALAPMLWTGKDLGRVVAAALKKDLDIDRGIAVFEAYYSFQQVADQFQEFTGRKTTIDVSAGPLARTDIDELMKIFGDPEAHYYTSRENFYTPKDFGVEMSPLREFLQEVVVPYISQLEAVAGEKA